MTPLAVSAPIASAADHGTSRGGSKPFHVMPNRRLQYVHQQRSPADPDQPADACQEEPFQQELQLNTAVGGAQRLAQPDLARTLGNRHQHDVHDSHRPQRQRHDSHAPKEDIHGIEYLAHHLLALDRVPLVEGVLAVPVEPVPLRDQPMDIGHRQLIVTMNARLVLDPAHSILRQVLPLDGEHLHHHRERNVGLWLTPLLLPRPVFSATPTTWNRDPFSRIHSPNAGRPEKSSCAVFAPTPQRAAGHAGHWRRSSAPRQSEAHGCSDSRCLCP